MWHIWEVKPYCQHVKEKSFPIVLSIMTWKPDSVFSALDYLSHLCLRQSSPRFSVCDHRQVLVILTEAIHHGNSERKVGFWPFQTLRKLLGFIPSSHQIWTGEVNLIKIPSKLFYLKIKLKIIIRNIISSLKFWNNWVFRNTSVRIVCNYLFK